MTHVAFQTGHSSGLDGRLFGRFDLAVAVFFALVGFPVVARTRRGGPGSGQAPADRSLSEIAGGPHHAGLSGGRRRDPDAVARLGSRQPDRLAREPDAHPDLCAADPDRRADPDVEPVRRGQLLPGLAHLRVGGPPHSGARPGTHDRRARGAQLGMELGAHPCRLRPEPTELATGVLLVVRRGHVAGRVGPQSDRVAAPAGPPTGADRRRRGAGVSGGGVAAGGSGGAGSGHRPHSR